MTNTTTESRLILLDELGGGTDPVAGSSLTLSVLEKLIPIGPNCRIIATTHLPQFKALSVNDRWFESVSVLMKVGSILAMTSSSRTAITRIDRNHVII